MNDWAANHPEEYREIAALPLNQQNAALREAIGYDPDAIRDRAEEADRERIHCHRDLSTPSPGEASSHSSSTESTTPGVDLDDIGCDACGAPKGETCQPHCRGEQVS